MSRESAIEAGASALSKRGLGTWEQIASVVVDAAAPHLVGEPVGYDYVRVPGLFATPTQARRTLTTFGHDSEGYVLVAFIPVEEQP